MEDEQLGAYYSVLYLYASLYPVYTQYVCISLYPHSLSTGSVTNLYYMYSVSAMYPTHFVLSLYDSL